MLDLLLAKFYKGIIMGLLIFILMLFIFIFGYVWYANSLAGDLRNAEIASDARVEEALRPYIEAEKAAQVQANEESEEYEKTKQAERIRTETIIKEVEKIVERPVYRNVCLDADGLSAINQGITSNSTS